MTFRPAAPAAVGVLLALAACSTPPDFFHTLRPASGPAAPAAHVPGHTLAIGPVTVPDALARDAWVVRTGETGVQVHEHQLWTQGLAAEIAQALADHLDRGPLPGGLWADAGPTGSGTGTDLDVPATIRVRVQVLRFDSILAPAPAVADQLRWALECLPSDAALAPIDAARYRVLRGGVRDVSGPAPEADPAVEASQQRYDRLARAHAQALRLVADDVAAALRDSAAERARDCLQPSR
jgi:uncharacterized lipoprotein YmbA